LLHKFASNLGFTSSGNSINLVNSSRGSHLTVGDLLLSSRRARGHLRRRAGMGKAPAWLLLTFEPRYKAYVAAVLLLFLPLLFPVATAIAPVSSRRCRGAFLVVAKRVLASHISCAPSQPALVA